MFISYLCPGMVCDKLIIHRVKGRRLLLESCKQLLGFLDWLNSLIILTLSCQERMLYFSTLVNDLTMQVFITEYCIGY